MNLSSINQVTTPFVSRLFRFLSGGLLGGTGALKLLSVSMEMPFLSLSNRLVPIISNRQLLLAAALLEIVVAIVCFSAKRNLLPFVCVLWLVSILASFRIIAHVYGIHQSCNCLGLAAAWLGLTDRESSDAMLVVLIGLGLTSALGVAVEFKRGIE